MEQIDALRAMLAEATPGEWKWVEYARCTPGEKYAVGTNDVAVAKLPKEADARLIAAMHNAMPALLDAAEMVEAMRWANDKMKCQECPIYDGCKIEGAAKPICDDDTIEHAAEWLAVYREREGKGE